MKRFLLWVRMHRLLRSGRRAMRDYLRATLALEMPFTRAEQIMPSLTARRIHALRCARRARRICRRLAIPLHRICPAPSSY